MWWEIHGKECFVSLTKQNPGCDRGNFLAVLSASGGLAIEMDACDLWPRYYFDFERAKLEVEAWLKKRGQFDPEKSVWKECVL